MIYRKFGKTGWNVSVVGLGTWNLGNQWGEMSDKEAEEIILTAIDRGINLLDTAESYGIPNGNSELRIGKALTSDLRDKVFVVSKIGNWGKRTGQGVPKTTPDMIRLCGHACAGRMKTDRIDVMLCHEGNIEDPSVYVEGFEALKEDGFIREYGISTNDLNVLRKFYEVSNEVCSVVEVDYSLINRTPEGEFLDFCNQKNLGILVRGPLAKGILAGKYGLDTVFTDVVRERWNRGESGREDYERMIAKLEKVREPIGDDSKLVETSLRFIISHEANPVAIPGATSPDQVKANALAGETLLDDALYGRLK